MQEASSLLTLSLRVDQYVVFIIKTNSTKNNYTGRARKDGSWGAGPQTAGVLHCQVSSPGSAASRGRTKQGRGSFCSLRAPNRRDRSRSRGRLRAPGPQSVACTGSRAGGTPPEFTLTSLGMWESAPLHGEHAKPADPKGPRTACKENTPTYRQPSRQRLPAQRG